MTKKNKPFKRPNSNIITEFLATQKGRQVLTGLLSLVALIITPSVVDSVHTENRNIGLQTDISG